METKQNLEEGCVCPACNEGSLQYKPINEDDGCSCHINPPCLFCTETVLACDDCGFCDGDEIEAGNNSESESRHKDLILEYAKDWVKNSKPWELWEYKRSGFWSGFDSHPIWHNDYEYRRKPKLININGFKVPEPHCGKMIVGKEYFFVILSKGMHVGKFAWKGDGSYQHLVDDGLVHLEHADAYIHSKAILSFTNPDLKP